MVLYAIRQFIRRNLLRAAFGTALLFLGAAVLLPSAPSVAPARQLLALASGGTYRGSDGVRFQESSVDCGVAALEMLFIERGVDPRSLDSVRAMVIARDSGLTMLEMHDIAAGYGLTTEGRRMNLAALAKAALPAIAAFPGHWVVIDRVTPDGYVDIRDPEIGRVRLPERRFLMKWTGRVLLVSDRTTT